MKKLVMLLAVMALMIPGSSFAKLKAPDVLDEEKIMTDESLSKYGTVGVRIFSTENVNYDNVDDHEMKDMKSHQKEWKKDLAKKVVNVLKERRINAVVLDEEGGVKGADVIVEGRFVEINLGNPVVRFGWGMGAGSASVSVEGELKDAKTGETLAKFEHESSSGWSEGYKWDLVSHEVSELGEDLAEFVEMLRK